MKRYLAVFVLLCIVSTAHGAYFQYYAGGLRAYYEVYADDGGPPNGPWSDTEEGISFASREGYAAVTQAYSHARNYILSKTGNNSIFIKSYSIADGRADNIFSYTSGEGFGSTQNSYTLGIFYKIIPDTNEQDGDDVMVYYNDTKKIVTDNGTTYVSIGGPGTMSDMAITRGLEPPVASEPDREYEVLRFPKFEVSNSSNAYLFSGVHAFPAQIGDVIGIFAENKTKVEGSGYLAGDIYSAFTMVLTVRAVLLGDLDYDDDVDLYDLAKLANNWLVDIGYEPPADTTPPTPHTMKWAPGGEPKEIVCGIYFCATMTADIATDPSGGIQYQFECTDESGFSSGGQADCMFNPGNCPEWRSSPTYTVTIGPSGKDYKFRVRARDIHDNRTGWSPALSMNP